MSDADKSTTEQVGRPFPKGVSGNPGGRPKVVRELQAILDEAAPDAVKRIIALCNSEDEKIALAASRDIADRVIGKARERDDDGKPVDAVAQAILELARKANEPKKEGE